MVNPRDFHLELRDELKLLEIRLHQDADLDELESKGFTIYQSLKNHNM